MTEKTRNGIWFTVKGVIVVVVAGLILAWGNGIKDKSDASISRTEASEMISTEIAGSSLMTRGAEIALRQMVLDNTVEHQAIKTELMLMREDIKDIKEAVVGGKIKGYGTVIDSTGDDYYISMGWP